MKFLLISRDLGVKQYHLALALQGNGHKVHFAYTYPKTFNWKWFKQSLPNPKAFYRLFKNTVHYAKDYMNTKNTPFSSMFQFSEKRMDELNPDIVYVSSVVKTMLDIKMFDNQVIWFDVEDSTRGSSDVMQSEDYHTGIAYETSWIINESTKLVTWGSNQEGQLALDHYDKDKNHVDRPPFEILYPYVSEKTVPKHYYYDQIAEPFSLVYAGSVWSGGGYRDFFGIFEQIAQEGFNLTVILSNSTNKVNWEKLQALANKYDNITARANLPFHIIKQELKNYHIGLSISRGDFAKYSMTYGMKPFEYAYAGLEIASLGKPIRNLSDHQEFAYTCSIKTIQENFQENKKNFDFPYHLMENRLFNITKILEENV